MSSRAPAGFADAADPRGVLLEKEVMGREVNIRDLSGDRTLVRFGTGDEVTVQAGPEGVRFLLISGAPIEEPVAWHGPIVMNTRDELVQAVTRAAQRDLHQAGALTTRPGGCLPPAPPLSAPRPPRPPPRMFGPEEGGLRVQVLAPTALRAMSR